MEKRNFAGIMGNKAHEGELFGLKNVSRRPLLSVFLLALGPDLASFPLSFRSALLPSRGWSRNEGRSSTGLRS